MSAWSPLSHLLKDTFLGHPPPPLLAPLRFWGGGPLRAVTPSSNLKTLPHNPKNWTAQCRPTTAFHCACRLGVHVHRAARGLLAMCVPEQEPPSELGKAQHPSCSSDLPGRSGSGPMGSWHLCWGQDKLPGRWTRKYPLLVPGGLWALGLSAWLLQVPAWSPLGHLLRQAFLGCPAPPPAFLLLYSCCAVCLGKTQGGRERRVRKGWGHPCSPTPATEHLRLCRV